MGVCKQQDVIHERQIYNVVEAFGLEEIASGHGLNNEISLKWDANTRWSSHFATLTNLILMHHSIIDFEILKWIQLC